MLADIYMIWGVLVTFLFLLCTAPGLVSAAVGCTMDDVFEAFHVWGQIGARWRRETCVVEPGAGTAREDRFEGSDAAGWLEVGSNPGPLFSHIPFRLSSCNRFSLTAFLLLPFSDTSPVVVHHPKSVCSLPPPLPHPFPLLLPLIRFRVKG